MEFLKAAFGHPKASSEGIDPQKGSAPKFGIILRFWIYAKTCIDLIKSVSSMSRTRIQTYGASPSRRFKCILYSYLNKGNF